MALSMVWSADCLQHDPAGEVWVGVHTPGTERPARATVVREAVLAAGATEVPAAAHPDSDLLAVHDAALLDHLRTVHAEWVAAGLPADPGQPQVVPYLFPTAGLLAGLPLRRATAVHARAGRFCYDTMTLVGAGTWAAARGAADAALTAADLVTAAGARVVFAACRPPGHHAGPDSFGGSCYLNNAALAAQALRRAGHERVAVVDVDAHHGNGTQAVFYDRGDVLYCSVHVDPGAGWFPHYVGFADETGRGDGVGATRNAPLPPGADDRPWLDAVRSLAAAVAGHGAGALVVSLGVDAAADDPESPLQVSPDAYHAAGTELAALGLPVVAVLEGGYHLPTLGPLVVATLEGLTGSVSA
ncbi:MAG: histone deacetylase family protein [Actinomycetia bacterium]|jgi:acetoin utilization deacetylase AcuC-like enzyme|nr:histone deacetylase family protein [Actinomycetes bacterium]